MLFSLSSSSLLLLSLLSLANAATTPKCNANNCARAVTGTAKSMTAQRKADCSSFLGLSPVTSGAPVITTVTTTARPVTSVKGSVVTSTLRTTQSTSVTTVISTSTFVSTVTAANNIVTILIVTSGPGAAAPFKREIGAMKPRQNEFAIAAGTTTQRTIPTYASACDNTSQYTSACSCFGITASTVRPTSTVTSTVTPTTTSTSFSTFVTTVTVT